MEERTRETQQWQEARHDPFREALLAEETALPQRVPQCAEPVRGEPAFDPAQIARQAEQIALPPDARFESPLLERAVRVGLAHIDATFQGEHPKYGVSAYARPEHDTFPPTIIAAVDALTLWGRTARAEQLFGYWLRNFVREDGSIAYYGPSISEYGQLLTSARRLVERGSAADWLRAHAEPLNRLARTLQEGMRQDGKIALLKGVPEADERDQAATYFHNSAWAVRGLEDWATVQENVLGSAETAHQARQDAEALRQALLATIAQVWPRDPTDWWLRPMAEAEMAGYWARPQGRITANRLGSYTNYRYWPELLSSGMLPPEWEQRLVNARLTGGGQFCGTTRFEDHLDDWPLMDYMEGLWRLGRYADYRLCLWGHLCYHQAEGHLTAYEQVSFPPGRRVADYCLPAQLVVVRAARRLTY
jgi:hypothetical protein